MTTFLLRLDGPLKEELNINEDEIESLGLLAIYREYENYNVNFLMLCHVRLDPPSLPLRILDAQDGQETKVLE